MSNSKMDHHLATAYHEAGHALAVHLVYQGKKKFKYVTIKPQKDLLGHIRYLSYPNIDEASFETLHKLILIGLAGIYAEKVYTGKLNYEGAASDYEKVVDKLLHSMNSRAAEHFLKYCQVIVEEWWKGSFGKELKKLAYHLYDKKTMTYAEFMQFMFARHA